MKELVFLKLGGSLITDKTRAFTVRGDILASLAGQIASALRAHSDISLILGHGSGSFGHTVAREYHTRDGLRAAVDEPARYWRGFAEVWYQASTLNRFVLEALHSAGVPAMTFSPAASIVSANGRVLRWDLGSMRAALDAGIVPVVHGDVVFDTALGGTILSTEDLFEFLAVNMKPARILLAGLESAVWADFPQRSVRVEKITPATFAQIKSSVGASHGTDVTGGMESKVRQMLDLAEAMPGMTVQIFSGEEAASLARVLAGEHLGTVLVAD